MSTGDGMETDADWTTGEDRRVDDDRPCVAASRTCPEKTVFAERGNTDAWIATDLTVELER